MFGSVLVTPTLLDGFEFAVNAPPSWKATAMKGFISKIRREKADYPDWVQKGMDFEDAITKVCKREDTLEKALVHGSDKFKEIVGHCYGGQFQNKLQKNLKIGQHKAFYFGFSDVEFPGLTIDIKTAIAWKGPSKYLSKNQHKVYLWINGKKDFKYTVTVWKDEGRSDEILSNHIIDYTSPGHDALERDIVGRTQAMFDFIQAQDLWEDYYFTFSKN
jgi:hypothetical protein